MTNLFNIAAENTRGRARAGSLRAMLTATARAMARQRLGPPALQWAARESTWVDLAELAGLNGNDVSEFDWERAEAALVSALRQGRPGRHEHLELFRVLVHSALAHDDTAPIDGMISGLQIELRSDSRDLAAITATLDAMRVALARGDGALARNAIARHFQRLAFSHRD